MSKSLNTQGPRNNKSTARSRQWKNVRSQGTSQARYVTKRSLDGGRFSPLNNPPDVNYQPWYSTTVVISNTKADTEVTVATIVSKLKQQVDPINTFFSQSPVLQLKIHEITAWNLTGKLIALSVTDFSDVNSSKSDREQLCGLVDAGTNNHIPAVGYLLPANFRNTVLRNDDIQSKIVIFNVQCSSDNQTLIYIRLSWKGDGPVKIPKLFGTFQALANIETSTGHVKSIKNKITEAIKRLPDTVKTVKSGVEMAAMLVAVLGDTEDEDFEDLTVDELCKVMRDSI